MTRTTILLVRHGETVWHGENRYAGGASDVDLTDRGRDQASQLAAWAADHDDFAVVACSPVRRAIETATPVAQLLGTSLRIVDDLREVDFGLAEGRTTAELRNLDASMVQRFEADPAAHPYPGSEEPRRAGRRAASALRQLAAEFPGSRVLVVAHNTVLRLALCVLLEVPVSRHRQLFPQLHNAAITTIAVPTDASSPASLLSLNERGHLAPTSPRPRPPAEEPPTSTTEYSGTTS